MLHRDRHDPLEPNGRPPVAPHAALEEVGDFHFDTDAFGPALEYYENALRGLGAELDPDPLVAARLHRKIADCYRSKGLLQEAECALDRATLLLRDEAGSAEWGVVLGRRADLRSAQGRHDVALDDAAAALAVLRQTAEHREYAFVLKVAASAHARLGHAAEFEQLNLDALAAYRRIEDAEGIADVHNNLGIAAKNACDWEKALRSLTKSRELGEQLGLTRRVARTLGNLGIVYTKTRDFHEAITHLRRARKLVIGLGDQASLVSILNSLGRVLTLTGRMAQAERCLLEARVLAERHHLLRSQALADEFLGDLMFAQGRLAEARENYESGLRKARVFAPKGDIVGEILRRLAELDLASGLRSQAIATAKRALRVCEGCGEHYEIGYAHRTLGRAALALGRSRDAALHFGDAIAAFQRTNNPYELAWTRLDLARLHLDELGREPALRAVREAGAAAEAFRAVEDDVALCHAGLILAKAHRAAGNDDDALLALCDVERACDENPELGLLAEAQGLRRELERAIAAHACGDGASLNLFQELQALATQPGDFAAGLRGALESLRLKTRSTAACIVVRFPARGQLTVLASAGMPAENALEVASFLASEGTQTQVLAHMDARVTSQLPGVAARAAAVLGQPLVVEGRDLGWLYLERARGSAAFAQDEVDFVATYAGLASLLVHDRYREEFQAAASAAPAADEPLHPVLRRIVTTDPGMFHILGLAQKVATSTCTVLLAGETGTGKGLLAQCIHLLSDRRGKRFIALNCAALPEPLLESELFGHVRGAFTGADSEKIGLLEAAHGGTIFLDEVGKTSLFMQGKLLQFLDSSEVRPVGSNQYKRVDVRVLCASKGNLRELVEQGLLLEDLYFRLNDFPIVIPPLRARRGDIRLLAEHALRQCVAEMHKSIPGFSRQAMQVLEAYNWPGNVRELEKCVKRAVILADERQPITVRHLPDEVKSPENRAIEKSIAMEGLTLREHVAQVEAAVIRAAMRRAAGNKSEAARLLGISYPSLLQKLKLYGSAPAAEA